MDVLIIDVLNYTRVMRSEALLVPVDLDKLVRDITATYPNWQPPKVNIQIEGTLPWVLGHEGLLTQCVSNPLSNALKFVGPGVVPCVRIRAEDRDRSASKPAWPAENGRIVEGWTAEGPVVRVWFEDNGIGIAESDRSRVFRMFDRINPATQFEGTGIGLTIVRKAVQRLSSSWKTSRTAFTFSSDCTPGLTVVAGTAGLPAAEPAHERISSDHLLGPGTSSRRASRRSLRWAGNMRPWPMKLPAPQPVLPPGLNSEIHVATPGLKGFEGLRSTDRAAREEIQHRAYSIWLCAGRPEHCEVAHWLAAEAEVFGDA